VLKSISSESFQVDKMGADLISIKVNGVGNQICVPVKKLDELINLLLKAETEFYPHVATRRFLDKFFK
jgi:hypothetical protein